MPRILRRGPAQPLGAGIGVWSSAAAGTTRNSMHLVVGLDLVPACRHVVPGSRDYAGAADKCRILLMPRGNAPPTPGPHGGVQCRWIGTFLRHPVFAGGL